jgi:hypothetical protein
MYHVEKISIPPSKGHAMICNGGSKSKQHSQALVRRSMLLLLLFVLAVCGILVECFMAPHRLAG